MSPRRLARDFSPSRSAMSPMGLGAGTRLAPKVMTWTRFLQIGGSSTQQSVHGFLARVSPVPIRCLTPSGSVRFAAMRPDGLILLTQHYYADGPAGSWHVSLPRLLRSDQQAASMLQKLAEYSRTYRLPFRLVEANSINNEGEPGVSDTLGAPLWGLELILRPRRLAVPASTFMPGSTITVPLMTRLIVRLRGLRVVATGRCRSITACWRSRRPQQGVLVQARLEPDRPQSQCVRVSGRMTDHCGLCLINKNVGRRRTCQNQSKRTLCQCEHTAARRSGDQ